MSHGRDWTPDDTAKLRRLVAAGYADSHIAFEMDRDRTFIVRKRAEYSIDRGQSRAATIVMARINMRRRMARA